MGFFALFPRKKTKSLFLKNDFFFFFLRFFTKKKAYLKNEVFFRAFSRKNIEETYPVCFKYSSDFGDKRIIGVWITQQGTDGKQH